MSLLRAAVSPGEPVVIPLGIGTEHGHHGPFYFEDSQVVLQACHIMTPLPPLNILAYFFIQVENQKYKVHRHFLNRESVFFKDMFSLSQSGDTIGIEGLDDEHPVILPETTTAEIENILRFFYFGYVRKRISRRSSVD
jgi:BTB/POZ domain